MRELQRTSFDRSWNFMKANDKISLVISSLSLILLVLLLLFYSFFSIVGLKLQIFGFFTVPQILSQILHFGGHGLYWSGSALIHAISFMLF